MKDLVIEQFRKAKDKLILLDYDGTLVDYQAVPREATPSENLLFSLSRLHASVNTDLVIITGRAYPDIDRLVGHLPIDIVAEHGAMVRENGQWHALVEGEGRWKQSLLPVLDRFTAGCAGSFIEEKRFSLAWHYRNAETEKGYAASRDLMQALDQNIAALNLKVIDGNKVVEIKSRDIDKGTGTRYLLGKHTYDFILSIGDDRTDEDMFEVLLNNPLAFTIKVGKGETLAKFRLENVENVIVLLNELI